MRLGGGSPAPGCTAHVPTFREFGVNKPGLRGDTLTWQPWSSWPWNELASLAASLQGRVI